MAKPKQPGLSYFSFDCDFFHDRKMRGLFGRFGPAGLCVYQYILCEIYSGKGYYVELDEDLMDAIIADLHLEENFIYQVLNYLYRRSLLVKLPVSVKVLTSKSIQKRYQSAKGAKSNKVEVDADIWLLNEEETLGSVKVIQKKNKSEFNGDKSKNNPDKSEFNTIKKSKVKKSKVKESVSKTSFANPPLEEVKAYIAENQYIVDAVKFYSNYESKNWSVNGSPLTNWKARLDQWEREDREKLKIDDGIDDTYDLNEIEKRAMFNDDYEV